MHIHLVVCVYRFLYEADVVIVMEDGRVSQFGHPRKVLPLVEEQLQSTREAVDGEEESEGGETKGARKSTGDTGSMHLQVCVHKIKESISSQCTILLTRIFIFSTTFTSPGHSC